MVMTDHPATSSRGLMPFEVVLGAVLKERRFIFGTSLGFAAMVGALTLVFPRSWTATAAFTPQMASLDRGRLAGLAAQLGVGLPGQDPAQQPSFYSELLQSSTLLRLAVDSPLAVVGSDSTQIVLLRDVIGGHSDDPRVRSERAVEALRLWIRVESTLKTGIVTLEVHTRRADLSQAIAERLLGEVDRFNRQTRQSQARQERQFLEARLDEARDSLRSAEDAMQAFLQRNREFSSSPQLTFERNRLDRRITDREQIVTTLAQAYEQSRIDEVRDTPLITVLQFPTQPALPDRRFLLLKMLLVYLGGTGLTVLLVVWRESARRALNALPDGGNTIRTLWGETLADLSRPLKVLRRSGRGAARDGEFNGGK